MEPVGRGIVMISLSGDRAPARQFRTFAEGGRFARKLAVATACRPKPVAPGLFVQGRLRTALEPDFGEIVLVGLLGKVDAASVLRRYPIRPPTPRLGSLTNPPALCDESDPAYHSDPQYRPFTKPRLRIR